MRYRGGRNCRRAMGLPPRSAATALFLFAFVSSPVPGFQISTGKVDPSLTAMPIDVTIWVKDGVTPADEARVLAQIEQGLQMWEDVPTSEIAFEIVEVIHATNNPGGMAGQLRIFVGNRADLTSGGAIIPRNDGTPGLWLGAVADNPELDLVAVTAHEIGHTLGLLHSTVSQIYPVEQRPIMHWQTGSPVLVQDDIAAISWMYPNPGPPNLIDVSGTIRGRLVVLGDGAPVSGVNVIAVEGAAGPMVARLSGSISDLPGAFELVGLPPGVYQVFFLDGRSFRGGAIGLPGGIGLTGGYQADNFADFSSQEIVVTVGDSIDLGDIDVSLFPLSLEGIHAGEIRKGDSAIDLRPMAPGPPDAFLGRPYEVWFQLRGGLRDVTVDVRGLPPGLTGGYAPDPRFLNVGVHGRQFVRWVGAPIVAGDFSITIDVQDARGEAAEFVVDLEVRVACGMDTDEDGVRDCRDACFDLDGDGFGIAGGGGNSCLGMDCLEGDASTYPGSPERNDGIDNQCPGEEGFGLADETSGKSEFLSPGVFSWRPQDGATAYEVSRSVSPSFSEGCVTFRTSEPSLADGENPLRGGVFFYLNRPVLESVGSWGNSSNAERLVVCPGSGPDLVIQSLNHTPVSPLVDDQITVEVTIANVGPGAAGRFTLSFKIGGEHPENPLALFPFSQLQPGESATFQRQVAFGRSGIFGTSASVDHFGEVPESDETNNSETDFYFVAAP